MSPSYQCNQNTYWLYILFIDWFDLIWFVSRPSGLCDHSRRLDLIFPSGINILVLLVRRPNWEYLRNCLKKGQEQITHTFHLKFLEWGGNQFLLWTQFCPESHIGHLLVTQSHWLMQPPPTHSYFKDKRMGQL